MIQALAVSPHLDDACLSFGSRLAQLDRSGCRVVVYTVFAGSPRAPYSPVAQRYHDVWGLTGDPVARRRREDAAALRQVRAVALHGQYLDAIYRRRPCGGWLVTEGTQPRTAQLPGEPELIENISRSVTSLVVERRAELLLTAAAVGCHVDHQRTRDAVLRAARRTGVPVLLWEDLPYALWTDDMPELPTNFDLGHRRTFPATEAEKRIKYRAVECYTSQLPLFRWQDVEVLDQLDRHNDQRARERKDFPYAEYAWSLDAAP